MRRRLSAGECSSLLVRSACLMVLCLASAAAAAEKTREPQQAPRQNQKKTQPDRTRRPSRARLQPIQLPEPATRSAVSFEQAVTELRDLQPPGNQRLDLAKISQLAWAIQQAMPSAAVVAPTPGQLSSDLPMQAYFVLPEGVFVYEPAGHTLQPLSDGDNRTTLAAALLKRPIVPTGGCQIIVAASARDFAARYGTQGRTVMAMQAGRMSQNIQLQAVAQGLTFIGIDAVEGGDVRRVVRIPRGYDPLYVAIVGYPEGQAPATAVQPATAPPGRRALLVVPPLGFQDEELFATRRALEQAGVQVTVASTRMGSLAGMLGGTTPADMLLNQVNLDNFDALVFIGGIGARDYVGNPIVQKLVRQAVAQGKVVAAIGTAPSILAAAGVLRGVRTTAYLTEQQRMVQGGAIYTGNPAEKDGLIITATGAMAVPLFAQAIIEGLGQVSR